jgi:hypothetical protein
MFQTKVVKKNEANIYVWHTFSLSCTVFEIIKTREHLRIMLYKYISINTLSKKKKKKKKISQRDSRTTEISSIIIKQILLSSDYRSTCTCT